MKDPKRGLDILAGGLKLVAGILNTAKGDLGCDWYCDNCGAHLNSQLGFGAGTTWTCRKCGYENDVSEDNIISSTYLTDDGLEVFDIPAREIEGPEDY